MTGWLRALFLVLALAATHGRAATFEEANQLYDQGKYEQAKAAYESLVASGAPTANVFFNLANTEFRLGALGRAAWHYERALSLDPAHPEARTNLALLRQQSAARVLPEPIVERALLPWTQRTYTILASLSAWTLVFALYAIFATRRHESFALWSVASLAVALAAYSAVALWSGARRRSVAIVLEREAVARVAPADRAQMVEPLPAGSSVRVLSERGAWTYCELPGQGRGWLPRQVLAPIAPGTAA